MNSKKVAILVSSAVVGLLATTTIASATSIVSTANIPAYAKSAVNVRTGPSTSYTRVDTLHRGENVTVRECQNGWCYIDHSGPDGWVSANYLGQRSGGGSTRTINPRVNFSLNFGSGGSGITISVGSGGSYSPPPQRVTPKVCFYKGRNYTGSSFCVTPGTNDNMLGHSWNNRISSIKVIGGANVQVCKNWNYSGSCKVYSSNQSNLTGGQFNNRISSYHTWM